ncbi:MAG TPA: TRAP transporter small permease [Clostridiales bacterium]|jgi:TRAP-type C4-dicarboxylate transport system permease small subunit|nr:TRAP transporter small permease [Clostridiales bacterium]
MKKILDNLEKFILVILALLFATMTIALFYQIIMRFVFQSANVWSEELTRFAFIWMSMLGVAVATRRSKNMDVDFIVNLMPKIMKLINSIFTKALIIGFLFVLIFYGIELVTITFKQLSPGMRLPMAYMYLSVPVGGILMLIFTIENIINDIKNRKIKES